CQSTPMILVKQWPITIKIASEVGAQMKLRFVTLMLHMLNFVNNSVERSRSAVAMGIQSSDFAR
ncbi:MAG: hypothetical protein KAX30_08955, partial [Candidatus Atribacteria bacterium]|nr:hypothetical protein [Candidatus Atribacteria bacterium]